MLERGKCEDALKMIGDYMSTYQFNLELKDTTGKDVKVIIRIN
jgi:hypothetical protein